MRLEREIVEQIWRACSDQIHIAKFADASDQAIELHGGPGSGHVLRANGSIYRWDIDFDGLLLEENPRACMQALTIAAKRNSIFQLAFPQRNANSIKCTVCDNGFVDFGSH